MAIVIARSRLASPAMLRNLQALSGRGLHASGAPLLSDSDKSFEFVVCGGGAGGLAVASSLCKRFGEGKVAVIEPAEVRSESDRSIGAPVTVLTFGPDLEPTNLVYIRSEVYIFSLLWMLIVYFGLVLHTSCVCYLGILFSLFTIL